MCGVLISTPIHNLKQSKHDYFQNYPHEPVIFLNLFASLGITPPAAKKLKTLSERKQKKMNQSNFRSLRLHNVFFFMFFKLVETIIFHFYHFSHKPLSKTLVSRGQSPANFMLDESSMSSISSTDTDATSVYDDGLFIQLPASPKTETLMAENLNDLSNFGL